MTRPPLWSWGRALAAAALLLLPCLPASAQDAAPAPAEVEAATPPPPGPTLDTVISEQAAANRDASSAQARVNDLDDETQKLLMQYRTALSEADSIKGYTDKLQVQVESQREDIASLERQLAEVETTAREVLPLTQKMLDGLRSLVELDVPFWLDERRGRIAKLDKEMDRADVTLSEKYRRVVEAYQIEMEYGRTIGAYDGRLGDGDDARTVQFLRIGRIALMYQTLDGNETGYWDKDRKTWQVDNDYRQAFKHGLGIAKKLTAPDLLEVPVPAPKETAS